MKNQKILQLLFTTLLAAIVLTVFGMDPVAVYPISLGLGLLSYFVVIPSLVLGAGLLVTTKSKELREEAGRMVERMRAITEKDSLTTEDEKEWDKLNADYQSNIKRAEMIEKSSRENAERRNNAGEYELIGGYDNRTINDSAWFDQKGREIRVVGPDESLHIGERAPLTFGAFVQSIARGSGITEAEKKALAEGSDNSGGWTVPDILLKQWIDKLRAKSVIVEAGARTVNLTSDQTRMAKLTGDAVADWIPENGAIEDNDMTFGAVDWKPKKLIGLVISSRELLEDSINVREMIERSFAETMALKLDEAALFGTEESNGPLGINTYQNLAVNYVMGVSQSGAPLTNYVPFVKLVRFLKAANAGLPSAFIMSPRSWEQLALLTATDDQPLIMPRALENIKFLDSSAIPENLGTSEDESIIFGGNFNDMIIGVRNSMKIEVLKERFASNYQYGFLCALRADIQPLNQQSFAKITKVLPEFLGS